jgi:tripartite-type tricarboxylate transporter receptor subunit TctC
MRAFMMKAGITFSSSVAYTGDAPTFTALLGGHIHVTMCPTPTVASFLAANQIKVLGNTGLKAITVEGKTIPSFKEQGYDLVMGQWNGVFAPRGTPAAIVKKLEDAFHKAYMDEEFNALANKLLFIPSFKTGKEFTDILMSDYKSFGEIIRATAKK